MKKVHWEAGSNTVAYLDRTNLSVAIRAVSQDMGFAGDRFAVTSSWALTSFLIGYAIAKATSDPERALADLDSAIDLLKASRGLLAAVSKPEVPS